MGAKGRTRRNFENGILTDDPALLVPLETQFDDVWARRPLRSMRPPRILHRLPIDLKFPACAFIPPGGGSALPGIPPGPGASFRGGEQQFFLPAARFYRQPCDVGVAVDQEQFRFSRRRQHEEPEVPAARKRAQLSRRNRDRRNDLGRKMVNADRLLRILREEQQPVRRPDAAGPGEFVGQRPGNFAGEQQRLPGVFR